MSARIGPVDGTAASVRGTISERQLQDAVLEMAKTFGWRCYHTHDSRRSQAGFPDLVMVRRESLIFAELKSEKGKVRPEQEDWLNDLALVAQIYIWRPEHWLSGRIENILR